MASIVTIMNQSEVFSAPSLLNICVKVCVNNAKTLLFSPAGNARQQKLRKSVHLPNDVWEKLIENFGDSSADYPFLVQTVYQNISFLRKIHVRNSLHLNDDDLQLIIGACAVSVSLDIHNCPSLTKKSIDVINKFGQNLESLCVGNSSQIIPINLGTWMANHKTEDDPVIGKLTKSLGQFFRDKPKAHGLLRLPKLRKLVIWGHHITQTQQVSSLIAKAAGEEMIAGDSDNVNEKVTVDYWEYLTRDFIHNLEYLDLSSCQEIIDLSFLLNAGNTLTSLHLHDVLLDYDPNTWGILRNLTKLKFLDVSQYNELASVFANPDTVLSTLILCLPELLGLDISGTNLAGFEPEGLDRSSLSCITGLASRKEKPLSFLGLMSTHYNAASRRDIPALQITGGYSIKQLLLSLKHYLHRNDILRKAVRILHQKLLLTNSTDFIPCYTILDLLLNVIKFQMEDKHIIIVALACCFHVLKRIVSCGDSKQVCKFRVNSIFSAIVRSMDVHCHDCSLLRNSVMNLLLLISHLELTVFHAEKLIPVLLKAGISITANGNSCTDTFLIRSIAHILYTFTHLEDKNIIEKLKQNTTTPEQMCVFMNELLSKGRLDQMGTFWIILLKFTVYSIENEGSGYAHFANSCVVELCFKLIKICNEEIAGDQEPYDVWSLREIQNPVIAFLTNLLRSAPFAEEQILKPENLSLIVEILNKTKDKNPKLQHVCCGLLAQVVSKNASKSLENPSIQEILEVIFQVMSNFCVKLSAQCSKGTFIYRNLNQLYDLLRVPDAPEVHIWALWTLKELIDNDHDKFVKMIIQDGKLDLKALPQLSSGDRSFRCFWILEALRGQLGNIIDNYTDSAQTRK